MQSERLRAAGLIDAEIADVINGAASFDRMSTGCRPDFDRTHRLLLFLGEPEVPIRKKERP